MLGWFYEYFNSFNKNSQVLTKNKRNFGGRRSKPANKKKLPQVAKVATKLNLFQNPSRTQINKKNLALDDFSGSCIWYKGASTRL